MKKYNFDELTDRRSTNCIKWDSEDDADVIPMWIADMDFRTLPEISETLVKRAESGIFGYALVPDAYYNAVAKWYENRYGWEIDPKRIVFTPGVVPALTILIKTFVKPGDGVIFQTPAYNCFFSSSQKNGVRQFRNPLLGKETGKGVRFEINFEELEELASKEEAKLLILCNPHNPTGRVWSREELERVRDICKRHNVRVLADEIHCDLVHDGKKFIPYATVDPSAIVCNSNSKTFNVAGLQAANIICPDAETMEIVRKAYEDIEICHLNVFGIEAMIAAYNHGSEWVDELNQYLSDNFKLLCDKLREAFPGIRISESEATYLAWVETKGFGISSMDLEKKLLNEAKVHVNSGKMYGDEDFIRINYACPRARLEEALHRIIEVLKD